MPKKTRAAVVLFVDIDEDQVASPHDLETLVRQSLYQNHWNKDGIFAKLPVNFGKRELEIRVVDVMDAGRALGNGYLWAEPTKTAWRNHGIYTEKEQAQLDAEKDWENEPND